MSCIWDALGHYQIPCDLMIRSPAHAMHAVTEFSHEVQGSVQVTHYPLISDTSEKHAVQNVGLLHF